jgi:predicted metal-dependent hydrolase
MKNAADPPALPAYSLRSSARARRISLRILPGRGLEVVLPARADPACVPELLLRHRAWIARSLARMPAPPALDPAPPPFFFLKGGEEKILLHPFASSLPAEAPSPSPLIRPPRLRRLSLPEDGALALPLLRAWIRAEARAFLVPLLARLAGAHGLAYSGPVIRWLRSRWGSCSAGGRIHLNACLLFLPEPQIRHVLLHELCHTRRLDHSPAFWRLLFALEPDALDLDRALRRAWRHVPSWVFAGG